MNAVARNASHALCLAAAAVLLAAGPVTAAAPVTSLDIVPADAAFYSAMLRNREQYDAIVYSKAWAKLVDLPYIRMGMGLYAMQAANPESVPGKFQAAMNNPESRKALEFLADILSDEIFIYGGPSINKTVKLCQDTFNSTEYAAGASGAHGKSSPKEIEEVQGRSFVQTLVDKMDLIDVPELVIGFKVKDKPMAEKLLGRLESKLKEAIEGQPLLEGRFKRATVAGHSYLTLSLDGNMAPWDDEIIEKIRGLAKTSTDGDKLIERLKKVKLVISLGLRDDFLVLAIGPSTDVLARLGGSSTLRSRPELAAVAKFADKRIASVGYSSKSLNERFGYDASDIDTMAARLKDLLPSLSAPAKLQRELAKSLDEFAADVKPALPAIGAESSISFLTASGIESYSYDWGGHAQIDSSKPLDILKHIGGTPILAIAGRSKVEPKDYDLLVKWVGEVFRYMEEYAPESMKPKERDEFHEAMTKIKPLAARLNKTTRELLLPALADGQSALVIDDKLTSRQFIKALPATEKRLPMIEPAIVIGVSDAKKLKAAFTEYYALADDVVEVVKELDAKDGKPDIPKDFKLPRPKMFHLQQGAVYGYALPAEWGLEGRLMPNAGLTEHLAVLSLSGRHTQRLLGEKEPLVAGVKLSTDRPLGGVVAFDFAGLMDALTPWVDLGLEQAAAQSSPDVAEQVRLHVKTCIEVLKVYRGVVSESYLEGKVSMTHTRSEYHDIED